MNFSYSRYYVYVKPVIKNPIVRTYSSLVFSLLAVTFFSMFALRPTLKTIISLQKDIDQQKQVLDQLIQKTKSLDQGIKNYQSLDSQVKLKLESLIPSKVSPANIIEELNTLATRFDASISAIQFQPFEIINNAPPPTKDADLKEILLNLSLRGSYEALSGFLNSLKFSKHLILVDTVNFNSTDEGLIMTVAARTIF